MIKQLIYGLLCLVSFEAPAQQTRDSIVVAVDNLFEAMRNADGVALKNCFSPNAVLQSIQQKDGEVKVVEESIDDFVVFLGKENKGAADERITIQTVQIDGPMAMVWAPYQFFTRVNSITVV